MAQHPPFHQPDAELKPINEGQDLELDFGGHSSSNSEDEESCSSEGERDAHQDAKRGKVGRSQEDFSFPMEDDEEHSPSSRSTTMLQSSSAYSQDECTAGLQALPGRSPKRVSQPRNTVSSSVPVRSSNVKMGSSVPVNIPMGAAMRARGLGGGTQGGGPALGEDAAAFIPPHQFSQRDDFTMGSFVPGETPGMAVKRERLRARNAILRSTGFLENNTPTSHHPPVVGSIPERPSLSMRVAGLGGLSQAIKAVGSPAS